MRSRLPTILLMLVFTPSLVKAQVIPDNTVGTQVQPKQLINGVLINNIKGGAIPACELVSWF